MRVCVYWKDEKCSSWAEYWIGGKGKEENGNIMRPAKMLSLFFEFMRRQRLMPSTKTTEKHKTFEEIILEFMWERNWISPATTIEHAGWWVWHYGKEKRKENDLNGV